MAIYPRSEQPLHLSEIHIRTAFDNCAYGCPKYSISSNEEPELIAGYGIVWRCKYAKDCWEMAHHLAKQVEESEE